MTPGQKRTVAILAIANVVVIVALVVLVTRPSGTTLAPHFRSQPPTPPRQACDWQATQLLAGAGLGGTVVLAPDGLLRFEIVYPLAPGQAADEVAQAVWTAFDIALMMREQEDECATFTEVEVSILAVPLGADTEAHSGQTGTQISASVSAADLMAFSAGELSEDEFIERVTYTTGAMGVDRRNRRDFASVFKRHGRSIARLFRQHKGSISLGV